MKKIYTILSLLFIGSQASMAQLTLTKATNEPVIGNTVSNAGYDSTSVIPKTTGAGQTWNFTSLTQGTFTETTTYTTVASAPNATAFPSSTMASSRGGTEWEYWKANVGNLEYTGQSNPSNNDLVVFTNLGTWINWPFSFGNTTNDAFAASQVTGTNTSTWNGSIVNIASGTGTVTLPGGKVHNNCLQIIKTITLAIVSGTNTQTIRMNRYEYWSSLTKFPILGVEYQTVLSGTTAVNSNCSVWINTLALTVGVNEIDAVNSSFDVYPNPANDFVNIHLPNNAIAEFTEVIDVNGKVVLSSTNLNSINLSGINKGVYFIRITNKDLVLQKQIVLID